MKRLKLLIAIFSVALSIPLAYFVVRTYRGLAQEEVATLRYFAETLFDKMEGCCFSPTYSTGKPSNAMMTRALVVGHGPSRSV